MLHGLDQSETGQSRKGFNAATTADGTLNDEPSESKYSSRKVNRKRVSKLMLEILACLDGIEGIERGELVECIFGLPRR